MQEEKQTATGQAPHEQSMAQQHICLQKSNKRKSAANRTGSKGAPRKPKSVCTDSQSTTAKRRTKTVTRAAQPPVDQSQVKNEIPPASEQAPLSKDDCVFGCPSSSPSTAPAQDMKSPCAISSPETIHHAKPLQSPPISVEPQPEKAPTDSQASSKTSYYNKNQPITRKPTNFSVSESFSFSEKETSAKKAADAMPSSIAGKTDTPKAGDSFPTPTYAVLCAELQDLCYRNPEFVLGQIGTSILGREIPIVSIGTGEKTILYIGGHHASEWITVTILLRFCRELASFARENRHILGIDKQYYLSSRRLVILPNLNPDGTELALSGLSSSGMLAERLERQNGGSNFSRWKANARGVDLNHNYAAGFSEYKKIEQQKGIVGGCPSGFSGEYPESEPEVSALCNWIRCVQPAAILTLHTQGEEIYASSCGKTEPHHAALAKSMERMTGYRFCEPEGGAAYGGLTDWFIAEFRRPAFTLECGKGETPLPLSDWFPIYLRLRTLLFRFPYLV